MTLQAIVRRLVRAAERLDFMAAQARMNALGRAVVLGIGSVRRERRHAPTAGGHSGQCGNDKDDEQQSVHDGGPRREKGG